MVNELKAHLSLYVRMAARGARIAVMDRDEPIAAIVPPAPEALSWCERMARQGRLRLGTSPPATGANVISTVFCSGGHRPESRSALQPMIERVPHPNRNQATTGVVRRPKYLRL